MSSRILISRNQRGYTIQLRLRHEIIPLTVSEEREGARTHIFQLLTSDFDDACRFLKQIVQNVACIEFQNITFFEHFLYEPLDEALNVRLVYT